MLLIKYPSNLRWKYDRKWAQKVSASVGNLSNLVTIFGGLFILAIA